jgi:hypothetical protein
MMRLPALKAPALRLSDLRPPEIRLGLALKFAAREMRGGIKAFRVFLACLALGVGAVAAVGSVKMAITAGLERESRAILGGDAELEFTYRRPTPRSAPGWKSGRWRFPRPSISAPWPWPTAPSPARPNAG